MTLLSTRNLHAQVLFSIIYSTFEKLIESDPEPIVDFLVHREFCWEMTVNDGLKLVTEIHPKYREECHFLFPAQPHWTISGSTLLCVSLCIMQVLVP